MDKVCLWRSNPLKLVVIVLLLSRALDAGMLKLEGKSAAPFFAFVWFKAC